MTKKKLVTNETRKFWQPVIDMCIKRMMAEGPRTNGMSPRSKIRVKLSKTFYFKKPFPKCVVIEETDEYIIREWTCHTLLDWFAQWGISYYDSKTIYKKRQRILMELAHAERVLEGKSWTVRKESVDSELNDVYNDAVNNE